MPVKKKQPATDKKKLPQKSFQGYVEQRLDASHKKAIDGRYDNADLVTIMESLAGSGLRPALKWDWDNDCWRLDCYRAFQGFPDSGYTYTARHGDIKKVWVIADYVINEMWDGIMPINPETDW